MLTASRRWLWLAVFAMAAASPGCVSATDDIEVVDDADSEDSTEQASSGDGTDSEDSTEQASSGDGTDSEDGTEQASSGDGTDSEDGTEQASSGGDNSTDQASSGDDGTDQSNGNSTDFPDELEQLISDCAADDYQSCNQLNHEWSDSNIDVALSRCDNGDSEVCDALDNTVVADFQVGCIYDGDPRACSQLEEGWGLDASDNYGLGDTLTSASDETLNPLCGQEALLACAELESRAG